MQLRPIRYSMQMDFAVSMYSQLPEYDWEGYEWDTSQTTAGYLTERN